MKIRFTLSLLVALFSFFNSFAQQEGHPANHANGHHDTHHELKEITLINGKIYQYHELKIDSNWISFNYYNKHRKLKKMQLQHEDVFTIVEGKKETVIYGLKDQDTSIMVDLAEMREIVAGTGSGRLLYKPAKHFVIGAAVGFAAGAISNSFLLGSGIPVVYTLFTTLCPVSDKHFSKESSTDAYRFGEKKQYKRMRTGTSIKSSIIGVAAGLIVGSMIANK